MPDAYCPPGPSLLPGPDQPAVLEEGIGPAPVDDDAATHLKNVKCQIDELRRLDKRMQLENLGLLVHNKELQARVAGLEAHNQELQARLGWRRYRLIDRLHGITRRVPLLRGLTRVLLLKGWSAAKKLRSWLAARKQQKVRQAL